MINVFDTTFLNIEMIYIDVLIWNLIIRLDLSVNDHNSTVYRPRVHKITLYRTC